MISYEDAKKKALELNSDVNSCYEYDNAYNFFDKAPLLQMGGK